MTLTISQLQQMYGTRNVQELKGANPNAAPKDNGEVDVLERNSAVSSNEIIPDEDNPLFMTIEQRALAHQIKREQEMQEMKLQIAEVEKNSAAMRREQAVFETLSPEEQRLYLDQRKQKELDAYHAYQAKEEVRIEKLKASLPPRINGALGNDLRLSTYYPLEEASFLEAMKVKYMHVKDAYALPKPDLHSVPEFPEALSNMISRGKEDAEALEIAKTNFVKIQNGIKQRNTEAMQAWQDDMNRAGNVFVMSLSGVFSQASTYLSRIATNAEGVNNATQDLETGNMRPFLREQIAQQQAVVDQAWKDIRTYLEHIKRITDEKGFATETAQYFADYTKFHTGTAYNLNAIYRDAGII